MVKLKRIKKVEDIELFQQTFNSVLGYSTVPLEYFKSGDCYAMFVDGKLIAGFCLVPGFDDLRSIQQLPEDVIAAIKTKYPYVVDNLADFTGYFINTKNKTHALLFTIYLVLVCLLYSSNYFIYSYLITEVGLGRYYGSGDPIRVHTGKPMHLFGHHDVMEDEHVEILSKLGIVKIFTYRTKRILKKILCNKLT